MPRWTPAGAQLLGPLVPAAPGPPPLRGRRPWVLAQPVAGSPQLGGGSDAGSFGGLRASGSELGCGRATRLAFSVLRGHGRAGQQGRRPPRRGGCLLLLQLRPPRGASVADSSPATLAAAARRPAASPPRAAGGGRRSAPRRACCGRRAGAPEVAASPCLRFPAARAGARAPRPRRWESAIGKLQRRPVERPPRDRRRRRLFPAPPRGRELRASVGFGVWGALAAVGQATWTSPYARRTRCAPQGWCGTPGSLGWVLLHQALCWPWSLRISYSSLSIGFSWLSCLSFPCTLRPHHCGAGRI